MKRYDRERMPSRQRGWTLIEVLVSMLVIGLALAMSISMLQTANRLGESAEYSAAALQRAQSIIDKIRANKIAVDGYMFYPAGSDGSYNSLYALQNMAQIPAALACGTGTSHHGCDTALPVAKEDMQQWRSSLQSLLPGGKGAIREIGAGTGMYEVIVMWSHNPESDAVSASSPPVAHGITVNFSL